jgi:hypothetical protein
MEPQKSPEEQEAYDIENSAAELSHKAGLGVSEWESFLGNAGFRLAELARAGFGTWGKENHIPAPYNDPSKANEDILQANPVLSSPGLVAEVERWEALQAEADKKKLTGKAATDFIAAGMTQGKRKPTPGPTMD